MISVAKNDWREVFDNFSVMGSRNVSLTEEPAVGWLRHEAEGERPYYKTPIPRTVIRDQVKLKSYLDKQHSQDQMLDIDVSMFSFKRRLGLREKKKVSSSNQHTSIVDVPTQNL